MNRQQQPLPMVWTKVFNLGGGNFDVSILTIDNGVFWWKRKKRRKEGKTRVDCKRKMGENDTLNVMLLSFSSF